MNFKKITSLTMFFVMLVMTYTGIVLFIAPPGRIAHWSNWEIFGLTKDEYANIHSTFMALFIFMTLFHIFYNFKPITSYMKNRAKEFVFFTKDMIVALVLTLVFLIGTLFNLSPFSNFLNLGDGVKNSWEKEYGTAPYSHAELSSLKMFSRKLGYDLQKSEEILKQNNLKYKTSQSLSQIGDSNGVSPQFIYQLLKKNFQKEGSSTIELTGLGRKTVQEVANTLKISTEQFISQLKSLGIEAKADEKFRSVTAKYDLSPMDVMIKLGYKK